jgi:hypothetical protein
MSSVAERIHACPSALTLVSRRILHAVQPPEIVTGDTSLCITKVWKRASTHSVRLSSSAVKTLTLSHADTDAPASTSYAHQSEWQAGTAAIKPTTCGRQRSETAQNRLS